MKKFILILVLGLFTLASFAQQRGRVYAASYDSVLAVETVYTGVVAIQSNPDVILIQMLCTDVGGTPDGHVILQGSIDGTSYINLAPETGVLVYRPNNDTLTITAGAIQTIAIYGNPFNYYRWKATGTSGDSTLITTQYIYK